MTGRTTEIQKAEDGDRAAGERLLTRAASALELGNGVLNYSLGAVGADSGTRVKLARPILNELLLETRSLDDLEAAGEVTVEGDRAALTSLLTLLDRFDRWFSIVTP